jgi:hypothetical protein
MYVIVINHVVGYYFNRHRHQNDHNCEHLVEKITPTKTAEHVQQILGKLSSHDKQLNSLKHIYKKCFVLLTGLLTINFHFQWQTL